MVDAKWPKVVLLASTAWTEGGEGEEASKSVFPHVAGSEESISFTMMLSKVFKVAIEHVQATPLRWPTCIPYSETFLYLQVKRRCLKMQKG